MNKLNLPTKMLVVAFVAVGISSCKCGTNNANATDSDSSTNESEITATTDSNSSEVKTVDGHECVDLGLPSGLLWATCNVGANTPEEAGGYYAWGETEPKEEYDWDTYKFKQENGFSKYDADGKTELDNEDDFANINWGGNWRMPSKAELEELQEHCNWTWNPSKKGYDIKSKVNAKAVFLPAVGSIGSFGLDGVGTLGFYWSRSLDTDSTDKAWYLSFGGFGMSVDGYRRYIGLSVRPVCPPAK